MLTPCSFYTMAKRITRHLFEQDKIKTLIHNYLEKTSNYQILDQFDACEITPTFNEALHSVVLFGTSPHPLAYTLTDLVGTTVSLVSLLDEFANQHIFHGHVFDVRQDRHSLILYYLEVLDHIPLENAHLIINWKRTASQALNTMIPDRIGVWNDIWNKKYKFYFSYHPAIFSCMNYYQGPMPNFLQKVSYFMQTKMSADTMDSFYRKIVCTPWVLKRTYGPGFIHLWHQVMRETAVIYLPNPPKQDKIDETISTITFDDSAPLPIANCDKLLCLLLILFERTYRQKLNHILAHEPVPPILAIIYTKYPSLQ